MIFDECFGVCYRGSLSLATLMSVLVIEEPVCLSYPSKSLS